MCMSYCSFCGLVFALSDGSGCFTEQFYLNIEKQAAVRVRKAAPPIREILSTCISAAKGLQALHEAPDGPIVHFDIKASQVNKTHAFFFFFLCAEMHAPLGPWTDVVESIETLRSAEEDVDTCAAERHPAYSYHIVRRGIVRRGIV